MILVQVDEHLNAKSLSNGHDRDHHKPDHISTGWVVLRSLTEFHVNLIFMSMCNIDLYWARFVAGSTQKTETALCRSQVVGAADHRV